MARWRRVDHQTMPLGWLVTLIILPATAIGAVRVAMAQSGANHPFSVGQFMAGTFAFFLGVVVFVGAIILTAPSEVAIGPDWVARRRNGQKQFLILGSPMQLSIKGRNGSLRVVSRAGGHFVLRPACLTKDIAAALLEQSESAYSEQVVRVLQDKAQVKPSQPWNNGASTSLISKGLLSAEPRLESTSHPSIPHHGPLPEQRVRDAGSEASPPSDGVVRFRPVGFGQLRFTLIFCLASGLVLAIGGALERNGTAPLITGCIILLTWIVTAYLSVPVLITPVVVSATEVVLFTKRGLKVHIGLRDVSGVGMICTSGGVNTGWRLVVWDAAETPHFCATFTARGAASLLVEETRAGAKAIALHRLIAERQGPSGLLLAKQLQLQGPFPDLETALAVWDPSSRHTRSR